MSDSKAEVGKVESRPQDTASRASETRMLRLVPWLACGVALTCVAAIFTNWNGWVLDVQRTQNTSVKSEPTLLG